MPRLGKIRLGDQSGTNGSPKNLPYFVVPDEVAAVYGANPTELPIVFLSDDEEVIASSYYRAYNASNGLVCKGDGFIANAMLDAAVLRKRGGAVDQPLDINTWAHGATRGVDVPATKNVIHQEIDCWGAGYEGQDPCPMFALKKCAVRSFFQFAIYGVPGLGVYQMDTGSQINVGRLLGTLAMARSVLGGISGVPMILSRDKTDVAPTGTKHGVYTVNLRIDTKFSLTEVLKLRSGPVANALLPPVDESEIYLNPGDDDEGEPERRDDAVDRAIAGIEAPEEEHEDTQGEPENGGFSGTIVAPPAPSVVDEPHMELSADELEALTNEARQRLYDAAIRIQKGGTMPPREYGAIIRRLGEKYSPDAGKFSTTTLSLEGARAALGELLEAAGEAAPPEVEA